MTKTMIVKWIWNGDHLADCKSCGEYDKVCDDGYCEGCFEAEE